MDGYSWQSHGAGKPGGALSWLQAGGQQQPREPPLCSPGRGLGGLGPSVHQPSGQSSGGGLSSAAHGPSHASPWEPTGRPQCSWLTWNSSHAPPPGAKEVGSCPGQMESWSQEWPFGACALVSRRLLPLPPATLIAQLAFSYSACLPGPGCTGRLGRRGECSVPGPRPACSEHPAQGGAGRGFPGGLSGCGSPARGYVRGPVSGAPQQPSRSPRG